MTTAATLRSIALAGLLGKTDAGTNVFAPRDMPTWEGTYPMLLLTLDEEDGDSLGRNGPPQFNVTATLRVTGRVEHFAEDNDQGAALVYASLETLRDQIKVALINYTPLMVELQQFPFFRSRLQVGGRENGAEHQGQVVVDIGLEFFQGPDDFNQPAADAFIEADISITEPVGTTAPGLTLTLPQ
ncbi:hypothetical protein NUJ30_08425 [Burkholderia contaminans]|uniref:ATP-binding protein n=1 Tax=Burkholderia TaxID=32008 RepID=UPI0010F9C5B8|nr:MULTISPECIES: ATP-binding protein [Burkholderia]MBD1412860.1 ATP-binding protein [Burkholderia contaminans]UXZ68689.1 hypothetical protein NUJ29_08430 [Burkholderia contaminans]UXZ76450.1 hypothetical protein NUJ30_08425 [Burkholderia contaminans]